MNDISFIIPCFRSENTIKNVIFEINTVMKIRPELNYEIIMVSDNSPDNVFEVIKIECNKDNNLKGILLSKNFGQHAALMAGYGNSNGDVVITVDDDQQTPIDETFKLIDKIKEGYDVVYASYNSKKHSWFRNFGSRLNDIMTEALIEKPRNLKVSSFFAMKKYVVLELLKYDKPYPYLLGLTLRATCNIANVGVNHRKRIIGKSGYTLKKLISMWLNGFTAFSIKPLRIATVFGIITAFSGFVFGLYTIINRVLHPQILAGYSSTMAVILFIGGMIMLMLGLLGEYIGRIYICINNSPQYVIREMINIEEKKNEQ